MTELFPSQIIVHCYKLLMQRIQVIDIYSPIMSESFAKVRVKTYFVIFVALKVHTDGLIKLGWATNELGVGEKFTFTAFTFLTDGIKQNFIIVWLTSNVSHSNLSKICFDVETFAMVILGSTRIG